MPSEPWQWPVNQWAVPGHSTAGRGAAVEGSHPQRPEPLGRAGQDHPAPPAPKPLPQQLAQPSTRAGAHVGSAGEQELPTEQG